MMTITRGLAVGVVLAGAAVGLATPASAELTDGTYALTYSGDSSPHDNFVVTSCGDGCKHGQILGAAGPVDFHLQGSNWTAVTSSGTTVTIDDSSLAGSSAGNAFQLVKVG